jgi:hypothetical protein
VLAVLLGLTIYHIKCAGVLNVAGAHIRQGHTGPALRPVIVECHAHTAPAALGLVAAEIAMSLTLLVACGLLLRTIYALRHVPLGFRTDRVMVASMSIPAYKYKDEDMMKELYQPLLERVQHLHGVESATLLTEVPLGKTFNIMLTFGDADGKTAADVRHSKMRITARPVGRRRSGSSASTCCVGVSSTRRTRQLLCRLWW